MGAKESIHGMSSRFLDVDFLSIHVINLMFAPTILPILFHFIFSLFLILQIIPFHFNFSTIFFNFPNPYTIPLNLNYLYHIEICKVKLFFKLFSKLFKMIKNDQINFLKFRRVGQI